MITFPKLPWIAQPSSRRSRVYAEPQNPWRSGGGESSREPVLVCRDCDRPQPADRSPGGTTDSNGRRGESASRFGAAPRISTNQPGVHTNRMLNRRRSLGRVSTGQTRDVPALREVEGGLSSCDCQRSLKAASSMSGAVEEHRTMGRVREDRLWQIGRSQCRLSSEDQYGVPRPNAQSP